MKCRSAECKGKVPNGQQAVLSSTHHLPDSRKPVSVYCKGQYKEDLKSAKAEFKQVFRKYGIPRQIHTDNGRSLSDLLGQYSDF